MTEKDQAGPILVINRALSVSNTRNTLTPEHYHRSFLLSLADSCYPKGKESFEDELLIKCRPRQISLP